MSQFINCLEQKGFINGLEVMKISSLLPHSRQELYKMLAGLNINFVPAPEQDSEMCAYIELSDGSRIKVTSENGTEFLEVLIDSVDDGIGRTGFNIDGSGSLLEIQSGDKFGILITVNFGSGLITERLYHNGDNTWSSISNIYRAEYGGLGWILTSAIDDSPLFAVFGSEAFPDEALWGPGRSVTAIPAIAQIVVNAINSIEGFTATIIGDENSYLLAQEITAFEDCFIKSACLGSCLNKLECEGYLDASELQAVMAHLPHGSRDLLRLIAGININYGGDEIVPDPIITGIPYPGQTLNSDVPTQWSVNGVNVGPPDATSYLVQIADAYLDVRAGTSDPVTVVYDPDVEAFRVERSLPIEQTVRLAKYATEHKATGADFGLAILGNSEFLARAGAIHNALKGPDIAITGTVGNLTNGIKLDGNSSNRMELDNPMPYTNDRSWGLIVFEPDAITGADYALISGALGSTTEAGPEVRFFTNGSTQYRVSPGPSGASPIRTRVHRYTNGGVGYPMLVGGQLRDSNPFANPIKDLLLDSLPGTATTATGWNNQPKWRIGSNLSNQRNANGKFSLILAGMGTLTRSQNWRIAGSIIRHGISSIGDVEFIGFIGDSMTVGVAGGAGVGQTRSELWCQSSSGWRGSFWDMEAIGGSPWSGASPTQAEFFATMMNLMALVPDRKRTIVFWPGYNSPAGTYENPSVWMALADNYIAAAATAAAAGIKTVHWSTIAGRGSLSSSALVAGIQAFNDYYRAGIAALDGQHICYNHRITFGAGEFDGSDTVNPAYFSATLSDNIHLSGAGQAALVADFLTQYPDPATAFS